MTAEGYIAILFFLAAAAIIGFRMYKNYKSDNLTIDDLIEVYGDKIISVIQSSVLIIKLDSNNYATKEEYEDAIIDTTYNELKKNAYTFGIPESYFNLFDADLIKRVIKNIFSHNKIKSFLKLDNNTMKSNENIIDNDVLVERFGN